VTTVVPQPVVRAGRTRAPGGPRPTGGDVDPIDAPPAPPTPAEPLDPALLERVRQRLARSGDAPTPSRVAEALRAEPGVRGDVEVLAILRVLRDELVGAGPLEPLLADPTVTDVLVNAPDEVWIDRGNGLERASVRFADDEAVRRLAVRLAAQTGRRLDLSHPFVDARLPDGSRLHAIMPPVAPRATCLSLRVLRGGGFTLDRLIQVGTVTAAAADVLRAVVGSRLACVVSGGAGSGKTTLLGVLLGLADPRERLVLVEDAGELRVEAGHVVRLETRQPNVEGAGEIGLRDLVRQALRMRPDRIVVGEVRGAEIVDLLAALNTGHEGGLSTVHANSARDVPARLEALAGLAGMPRAALHSQLAAALHVVVHMRRGRDGRREVGEIAVFSRERDGLVTTVPALRAEGTAMSPGPGAPLLADLLADRDVRLPPNSPRSRKEAVG
jgi:pilus assembly protein CpaF